MKGPGLAPVNTKHSHHAGLASPECALYIGKAVQRKEELARCSRVWPTKGNLRVFLPGQFCLVPTPLPPLKTRIDPS